MSMESDLVTLLKTICTKTFPDTAPPGTTAPYITFAHFGGRPQRYIEGAPAPIRNTYTQVDVWHSTRAASLVMMRQVEELLCQSALFYSCVPSGEPNTQSEPDIGLYGCQQDFDIWAAR